MANEIETSKSKKEQHAPSIVTQYSDALIKLQSFALTALHLKESGKLIAKYERNIYPYINSYLISVADGTKDGSESKNLEWCISENAKICAEWIDKYNRKTFKTSARAWLPVVLNIYVRLNRLNAISRLLRGEYASENVFINLSRALSLAYDLDIESVVADEPNGDGKETALGSFTLLTLIYNVKLSKLSKKEIWGLLNWLTLNLNKVNLSNEPPQDLSATWVIEIGKMDLPKHATIGMKSADGRFFLDARGLESALLLLHPDNVQARVKEDIFEVGKLQIQNNLKASTPIEMLEFNFDFVYKSLSNANSMAKSFTKYTTVNIHEYGVGVLVNETQEKFRLNQIFLSKTKQNSPFYLGIIRKIEKISEKEAILTLDWIGTKIRPIKVRSEWADVADSNRPEGWLECLLMDSVKNKGYLNLFLTHLNVIWGEYINCTSSHKDEVWSEQLMIHKSLELYPNHMLVEASWA